MAISGYLPSANAWFQQAPNLFPGSAIAGFTPLQRQAWGSRLGAANNIAGAGTGMYGGFAQDMQLGKMGNPWLNSVIRNMEDLGYQNFRRNTIPSLTDRGTAAGQLGGRGAQYGGTRTGIALGNAAGQLDRTLSDARESMLSTGYQQGLDYTRGMYNIAPNMFNMLSTAQMAPSTAAAAIGEQQQAMNQARLTEARNMWNEAVNAPYERLRRYQGFVEPAAQMGSTRSSTNPYAGGQMQGMLGGAIAGGRLANQLYNAWGSTGNTFNSPNYVGPGMTTPWSAPVPGYPGTYGVG